MERRDFINNLGQAASFVCMGSLLAACSKSSSQPVQPGGGGSGSFTINLDSDLISVGSFKIKGNVIVIRIAAGNDAASFVALSTTCTHQGCTVNYDQTNESFKCPCHGSEFDVKGSVLQGPASAALPQFKITVSGNTLTTG
jgi:cytochrome b6-f complex iron-sulfur subunit